VASQARKVSRPKLNQAKRMIKASADGGRGCCLSPGADGTHMRGIYIGVRGSPISKTAAKLCPKFFDFRGPFWLEVELRKLDPFVWHSVLANATLLPLVARARVSARAGHGAAGSYRSWKPHFASSARSWGRQEPGFRAPTIANSSLHAPPSSKSKRY
jgi:hypothetical protein